VGLEVTFCKHATVDELVQLLKDCYSYQYSTEDLNTRHQRLEFSAFVALLPNNPFDRRAGAPYIAEYVTWDLLNGFEGDLENPYNPN